MSLFDKLQNVVENKLAAFKDREKIEGNSHYNYVVSPLWIYWLFLPNLNFMYKIDNNSVNLRK